ncbi:O-antigen translocase [Dysgonomonas massiliensis]|uniref:O-antigen translocase n=1 Tax=Dysgonomonas massiliensis TaxID=2040292 RepID=UPI00135C4A67|nr:O-antigen translocase [Dysgonomonas massiliensis]
MSERNDSYKQIVKATGIFGGSQIVIILLGIIRTKFAAFLLGALGVGLIGIFQSVVDMIRTISVLGVDTSGVKEIADTETNKSQEEHIKTISTFRLWFSLTAFLGLFICFAFCFPISLWAFQTPQYAMHVAGLSLCVFFGILATGRSVILQGLRQIGYMAKAGIWTALASLIIIVPMYYFMGTRAIVPSLIIGSLLFYIFSDYYFRKLKIKKVSVNNQEAFEAGTNTLKLGLYILISSILNTIAMFVIRTYIARVDSIEYAGLFQAVWVITTVYLGLILKSMGADYYPRLSAISDQNNAVKTLVNEQSYIAILVSLPIIVGMILFSKFILTLFYSTEFIAASELLRWQLLGSIFKIISWPLAFILLAKNKGKLFLLSEIIFYASYLSSAYLLYSTYSINAFGIAYLIAYIIYLLTVFVMAKYLTKFEWTPEITSIISISLAFVIASFIVLMYFDKLGLLLGIVLLFASTFYSYIKLNKVFTIEDLKNWINKKE